MVAFHTRARVRRSFTALAACIAISSASLLGMASPAAASPSTIIPEWYQFCANIKPVGITAGRSGYVSATAARDGVTCKYWVISWGAGFPYTTLRYFSWQTVCRSLGYPTTYWQGNYPRCSR